MSEATYPVVHRQSIPIDDDMHELEMPKGAGVCMAGRAPSSPNDVMDLWYGFIPGAETETRVFKVYATGQPWSHGRQWIYCGSHIDTDLRLVWHLVEVIL